MRPVEITVRLDNDPDTTSPMDWDTGGFKIYTLGRGKLNTDVKDRDEWLEEKRRNPGFQSKLRAGTAFPISYFEHGDSVYSLQGTGPQCDWDNVPFAGFVVWEGKATDLAATYEARRESAKGFLEEYTAWANGECYWYSIECEETGYDDSCGGFIGSDYFMEEVAERLKDCLAEYELTFDDVEIAWEGDAAWLSSYFSLSSKS